MRTLSYGCLLLAIGCTTAATEHDRIRPSEESRKFVQDALDGWERMSRDFLHLDPHPLPWIVAFDQKITWHVNAPADFEAPIEAAEFTMGDRTFELHGIPHQEQVELPSGSSIPVAGVAFASLATDGSTPFFVVALPEVWRLNPAAAQRADLMEILGGVVSHEIVHTRQLNLAAARVRHLQRTFPELPSAVNDDMVQERFADDQQFTRAWEEETDLFFRAADAEDPAIRNDLARAGIELARTRRHRFYQGADAYFAPIEDLFLNMEGVAVLASFRLTHGPSDSVAAARGNSSWSQDQGFALLALCDAIAPDWRQRTLGAELVSPFELLAQALQCEW